MKISRLLRVAPVVFALFLAAALIGTGASFANERSYYNEQKLMNELDDDLNRAVKFLNQHAVDYVESEDIRHFDAYMNEAYHAMTRERVIMELERMNAPENEIGLAKNAVELSYAMGQLEEKAISEAGSGNSGLAREILGGEEYKSLKSSAEDALQQFRTVAAERCANNLTNARNRSDIALYALFAAVALIVAAAFLCFHFVAGKIGDMTEMAGVARQIANGDLSAELAGYESGDEFGTLAKSLGDIMNTVKAMEGEVGQIINDASGGNLMSREVGDRFGGSWARILQGINDALKNVRVQIIENAPAAYVVIVDDIIADCNQYAANQLGMVPGEPMEQHYKYPYQRRRILSKLKEDGAIRREHAALIDINGEVRRYSIYINATRSEGRRVHIIWGMDIEDEERNNDTIRRNQKDLQKLIDTLPMAMTVEEPVTGKVRYANAAFYKLMGIPLDSVGVEEKSLYADEQSDGISAQSKEERLASAVNYAQGIASEEFTYNSAYGEKIDTRVTAGEIIYNGERSILKVIQNISGEKLKNKLLEDAIEHELEANRLKSRFLANMSHEIRTPMNAIIGFAQIALMRQQDAQNLDAFRKINSSAKNLLTILNDILDFSKIEAQKLEVIEDVFVLEDIVANAFLVASERIEDKRVEMLLDMEPDLPVKLIGDKTRLWQILKNLLDNSAKYTEAGFIIIKVFKAGNSDESRVRLTFQINDTGIGMTEQQVRKLFVPFAQFSDSYKYKSSGTGLGMSITKELVELLGGDIQVSSEVGVGTQFTVTVDFKPCDDITTLADSISRGVPEKFSVLIADDDPIACEIMARILEAAGFETLCVNTGDDAIFAAKERDEMGNPFNIIILDYILGEENGIEIGRRISQNGNQSKLLMVSAYVKKIPEDQIQEVGFKDVLQKPFIPSMLVKRLYDTLDDRGMRALAGKDGFNGARVLLCEDNQLNREIAVEMLRLMGVEPDVAGDGEQCIKMLEKREYDLVLMDILMPVMDGITATKNIRESEKAYRGVKIIAMTANVMREHVEEFARVGMDGHIPKPVEFDTLYDMLIRYLPPETLRKDKYMPKDEIKSSFSIKGIEVREGVARFGGNEERYKTALMRFIDQGRDYGEPDGSEEFRRYIHTMKGVAANLGINKVAALAKSVESDLYENRPADASFEALMSELDAISERVRIKIAPNVKKPKVIQDGTKEEYLECVARLKETVEVANATDSDRILNRLVGTRWHGVPKQDFMPLAHALADYDFARAIKLVELL